MAPSILIVDDNYELGNILEASFREEGYDAEACSVGQQFKYTAKRQPDLVILASLPPSANLLQTFCKIRLQVPRHQPAILALGEQDLFRLAIDAGADDYLVKPFAIQELLSRSGAMLRRTTARPNRILNHSDISVNLETHRVTRQGRDIQLGPTEFRLLTVLLQEPAHLFSRREILAQVWKDTSRDERMVDVGIKNLRNRLNVGSYHDAIRTVRGVGYGLHTP
jgi:two-component system phosphate regulon response regulator PhoB